MNDAFLGLVAVYGLPVVFVATFLSCLAVPVPTSLVMLAAGAFAASGDLSLWQVVAAAYAGAILGDQAGFRLGRTGGSRLASRLAAGPPRAALLDRARGAIDRWGGTGIFLSTWLFAPLGPWVNLLAGATGFGWARFTAWDSAGEAVWVTLYVGLGYLFADRITQIAGILGNSVGFLVAGLATIVLARMLLTRLRQARSRVFGRPSGGPA
jgi:membrane-associated protein